MTIRNSDLRVAEKMMISKIDMLESTVHQLRLAIATCNGDIGYLRASIASATSSLDLARVDLSALRSLSPDTE